MRNPVIESDLNFIVDQDLPWGELDGKTILVSGAAGFLPSYFVETLLYLKDARDINVNVIGLVRNLERAQARFAHYNDSNQLQLVQQDVTKPFELDEKIDYIVHAASNATPKVFREDPVGTVSANVYGTGNLLDLGVAHDVEGFLFFSTSGVNGHLEPDQYPARETDFGSLDPMDLASSYLESKRMGENMCVSWMSQHRLHRQHCPQTEY